MAEVIQWANSNSGFLALVALAWAISGPVIGYALGRRQRKPKLKVGLIKTPTYCSCFTVSIEPSGEPLHRTAYLVYLHLTNTGPVPIQIGDVHVGYLSAGSDEPDKFRWLVNETAMLEEVRISISPTHDKLVPFLKQAGALQTQRNTYLQPGEDVKGLVYFEQEESRGLDYPYMDENCQVATKIRVYDTLGNYWETDCEVPKVKIEAIRKEIPTFGATLLGVKKLADPVPME